MPRASFRQSDLERIFRAAKATGATVRIELQTLVLTLLPGDEAFARSNPTTHFAPDGKEDWTDIEDA